MRNGKLITLAGALLLMAGAAVAGTTTKTSNTTATETTTKTTTNATLHHESGTASSVTANELILDHTWKGKAEKTTFTLDSATKKEGNLKQGDHLTVYYHLDKGQRVATEIKQAGMTSKSQTKKS
jgi:hypothetical protein